MIASVYKLCVFSCIQYNAALLTADLDTTDALVCHIHLPECLWIMGPLTAELQRRIQAMEMRCYRKILHISYKDHVTNEEVHVKIQQAIGPHEDLVTIVKRLKLQWHGHVSRSSGLARTILQGTVKGGRRQGGQKKRWEDNIRQWTSLEFGKSQRAVKNRGKWRKLVAKSSVVPQQPSQFRDWWDGDLYNIFNFLIASVHSFFLYFLKMWYLSIDRMVHNTSVS